ncbi:MAG: hypothetical protein HC811_01230 [Flammeovirgaceae bacterium]|nr:hypothetical protein [Flammeovirgaceae bacterium]
MILIKTFFFLGIRYGTSRFDESLTYTVSDPNYGDLLFTTFNDGLTGSWFEITTGLKVRIWKGLFLGFTGRFKFAPSVKGDIEFMPYDIPGYGLASENTYWGFNYQVFWRFQIRK